MGTNKNFGGQPIISGVDLKDVKTTHIIGNNSIPKIRKSTIRLLVEFRFLNIVINWESSS